MTDGALLLFLEGWYWCVDMISFVGLDSFDVRILARGICVAGEMPTSIFLIESTKMLKS